MIIEPTGLTVSADLIGNKTTVSNSGCCFIVAIEEVQMLVMYSY